MNLTFLKKYLHNIRQLVTIEPIIGTYVFAALICRPALLRLEIEKTCKANLKYNDTVCGDILNNTNLANHQGAIVEIVSLIEWVHSWQTNLESFIPLVLIAIVGSFSDKYKIRRPFLLLAFFGEFLSGIGCIISVIFMKEWVLEVLAIIQLILPAMFGGPDMILTLTFAYISDITNLENRTFRIGVVQIVIHGAMLLAEFIGTILIKFMTYIQILSITIGGFVIMILLTVFWLVEIKSEDLKLTRDFIGMFKLKDLIDVFKLIIKNIRTRIAVVVLMGFFIDIVYNMVLASESDIFYTYTTSFFHWNDQKLKSFINYNNTILFTGLIIGMFTLVKWLNINDSMVLAFVFLEKIISNIIFTYANTTTGLYMATTGSMLISLSLVVLRSMATKVVSPKNFAKIQVLLTIRDVFGRLIGTVGVNLYRLIYAKTVNMLPGAFFLFGSALYGSCLPMILYYYHIKI